MTTGKTHSTKALLLLLLFLAAISWPAHAQRVVEIYITEDGGSIGTVTVDGETVWHLNAFEAIIDEYSVTGVRGTMHEGSQIFESIGSPQSPATLRLTPAEDSEDRPVFVSAEEFIRVFFEEERMIASGNVHFESEDTKARADMLMIDTKDVVWATLVEWVSSQSGPTLGEIVIDYFAERADDARLVLLRGNVAVDREDSSLTAGWIVFDEADPDQFVSGAGGAQPIQIRLILGEN